MAQYKVLHTKLTMSTTGGTVYVYMTELGKNTAIYNQACWIMASLLKLP